MITYFIGQIEREYYKSLTAIPSNQFPPSFEAFCFFQDDLTENYRAKGAKVITIKVDVQEFAEHCRSNRKPLNAHELNNFAFSLANRQNNL